MVNIDKALELAKEYKNVAIRLGEELEVLDGRTISAFEYRQLKEVLRGAPDIEVMVDGIPWKEDYES